MSFKRRAKRQATFACHRLEPEASRTPILEQISARVEMVETRWAAARAALATATAEGESEARLDLLREAADWCAKRYATARALERNARQIGAP